MIQRSKEVGTSRLVGKGKYRQGFLSNTGWVCFLCFVLFVLLFWDFYFWWAGFFLRCSLLVLNGRCSWGRASTVPGEGAEECNCHHNSNHHHYLSTYRVPGPTRAFVDILPVLLFSFTAGDMEAQRDQGRVFMSRGL